MHPSVVVTDLGFGDAGKGSVVDALARRLPGAAVVRFNGGGQAAHNVVTDDGRHHKFSQFGSGTFVPGVPTHLSRFMLVDPVTLMNEAAHLGEVGCPDAPARLTVDGDAKVVTAFHKVANRFRETLRGDARHGSCGMGIGETMASDLLVPAQTVYVRDLRDPAVLHRKLAAVRNRFADEFRGRLDELIAYRHLTDLCRLLIAPDGVTQVADGLRVAAQRMRIVSGDYLRRLAQQGPLIFEGAQGVLLDEWYGFHPYTTWSTTTPSNALALLDGIGHGASVHRLGVLRAYHTRHGDGPFPTEDTMLTKALPDTHNGMNPWQKGFRVGWFDAVLARYAIAASGGIDSLAVTCLDRWAEIPDPRYADAYRIPPDAAGQARRVADAAPSPDGTLRISDIRVKPLVTDLAFQEVLTTVAASAAPVLQQAPTDGESWLRLIERLTGVPVSLESWGPAAAQKRFRDPVSIARMAKRVQ